MKPTTIQPTDVHVSAGYSHAVRVGDTLYISGQVPRDPAGKVVGDGDFETQARQVYTNLERVLAAHGGHMRNVIKVTTYLTEQSHFERWRAVRGEFLREPYPASTLVIVKGLSHPEYLVEIEAIAVLEE